MSARMVEAHLIWLKAAGRSPATIDKRRRLLMHMHAALPYGIDHADEEEIAGYLASYDRPWTRYTYDTHARGFYRWAVARGLLTLDPMAELPKPGQGPATPRPCTDAELAAALTAPAPYGRAILMAARAGLRCGEIARAHRDQLTAGRLRVLGKGGKERTVPLDDVLLAELADEPGWLLGVETDPQRLTNGQRDAWETVGLPASFHLHSGRHWFATRLLESGALITEVQRLLGHSSLATTQGYLQVVDARLAAAVRRLPVVESGRMVAGPTPRVAA